MLGSAQHAEDFPDQRVGAAGSGVVRLDPGALRLPVILGPGQRPHRVRLGVDRRALHVRAVHLSRHPIRRLHQLDGSPGRFGLAGHQVGKGAGVRGGFGLERPRFPDLDDGQYRAGDAKEHGQDRDQERERPLVVLLGLAPRNHIANCASYRVGMGAREVGASACHHLDPALPRATSERGFQFTPESLELDRAFCRHELVPARAQDVERHVGQGTRPFTRRSLANAVGLAPGRVGRLSPGFGRERRVAAKTLPGAQQRRGPRFEVLVWRVDQDDRPDLPGIAQRKRAREPAPLGVGDQHHRIPLADLIEEASQVGRDVRRGARRRRIRTATVARAVVRDDAEEGDEAGRHRIPGGGRALEARFKDDGWLARPAAAITDGSGLDSCVAARELGARYGRKKEEEKESARAHGEEYRVLATRDSRLVT